MIFSYTAHSEPALKMRIPNAPLFCLWRAFFALLIGKLRFVSPVRGGVRFLSGGFVCLQTFRLFIRYNTVLLIY